MNIDVYNTHIEVYPYEVGNYQIILKEFTAIGSYDQKEFPCGYIVDHGKLYLPRGANITKLEYITQGKVSYIDENDPSEDMEDEYNSLYEPRNKVQEETIDFLLKTNNHQLAVNLDVGWGKSFCIAYTITKLKKRAIIIIPNEGLKQQWMTNTFCKMFTYKPSRLMNIAGGNIINGIMNDDIPLRDVYFVNHATLRNYVMEHGGYALHKFFKKLKVDVKVYDEAHMEFANILLIDHFTNTNRTWYLTATFDRSDKSESACFRKAFSSVDTYGEMESRELTRKHILYHVVNFNSRPTPKDRGRAAGYGGFTAAKYGRYSFLEDKNDTAYRVIQMMIEKLKNIEGKILLFIPLIEAVDVVANKLRKDFPEKRISVYHSKADSDEKKYAFEKDIIVSTVKSCGTGKDIKGLRAIISSEPIASKVITHQQLGRLREYAKDKDTYYFDLVNVGFFQCNWWFRARMRAVVPMVKEVIYLNLDK